MTGYQPARLIELIDDEPAGDELGGEALMWVSRDERGVMEASGTFRTGNGRPGDLKGLLGRPFQYEGPAFEGDRRHELRGAVVVTGSRGGLYDLETVGEPLIVHRQDATGRPVAFPDTVEFDPNDEPD